MHRIGISQAIKLLLKQHKTFAKLIQCSHAGKYLEGHANRYPEIVIFTRFLLPQE
jgi:hypothetical protein